MTFTTTPATSDASDVSALVARVADLERTQRTEDVDGFVALFDPDAVWVSAMGKRLVGRAAIAAFTRQVLPGAFADGSVRYDVEHIRFITPDVALTAVNQEYLTADGRPLTPPQRGRPSYIWRRHDDTWLISSGQNTQVPADEKAAPAPPPIDPADEAAIRGIVADIEAGFNGNDPDLLVRHIAPDALVVNALGGVLHGREEIDKATRAGLARGPLHDATAHYRLTDITLLSPDIAVAHKNAWSTPEAADSGASPEMNALYVLARRDGRWWIVRRQNTLVSATPPS